MGVTVIDLIRRPFKNRNREEKEKIVMEGKPRPQLLYIKSGRSPSNGEVDENSANNTMSFDVASYDHVEWMTGCDVRQSLFCWPCLLFRVQKSPWNCDGIDNLSDLRKLTSEHQKSVLHMQAVLDMQLFAITLEKPKEGVEDKDVVKRDRAIAHRLIDIICFLVSQKPCMGSRNKNTIGIEDCLENFQFLRDYDHLEASSIEDAIMLLQITPKIVTDMADAITSVVKAAIKQETHKSSFVSIILTHHSDEVSNSTYQAPNKALVSTVLRYLNKGEVCERFIGYTHIERSKFVTQKILFQHIHGVINDFDISRRVIAYSLDGSILSSAGALYELQKDIIVSHPYVFFLPSYEYKLDFILLQSLNFIKGCEEFYRHFKTLLSCFEEGSKMIQEYESFRESKFILNITRLDVKNFPNLAELLSVIKTHRRSLVAFFDFSINNPEKWTKSDVVKMAGLRAFLKDDNTVFLIEVLIKVFDLIAPLVAASNSSVPGLIFDISLIESVKESFNLSSLSFSDASVKMKEQVFSDFENEVRKFDPSSTFQIAEKKNTYNYYNALYIRIFKYMEEQITFRFHNAEKMSFCHILNLEESKKGVNSDHVITLITTFGQAVKQGDLETEIKLLIPNKPPTNCHELLKFFLSCDFGRKFPCLHRICEIILTLPSSSLNTADQLSKLRLVDSWSYKPGKIAGDLSLLCIEQDLLKEARKSRFFYEEVMTKFQEKNKDLQLDYEMEKQ